MPLVVLDQDRQRVAANVPGEVCMLGPCVALGYLADPELTRKSFWRLGGLPAFSTGDLGVQDESGSLTILGRMGSMVKVNGHRVDVCEVEGAVASMPGIHRAVAFLRRADLEIAELWLAVELQRHEASPPISDLKSVLRRRLPAYMVPKRIVFISSMPLTPNGKIDRKALAAMEFDS
jgi:acyl-coenzyme A synthetase/AMP-(fatty) acid ligase